MITVRPMVFSLLCYFGYGQFFFGIQGAMAEDTTTTEVVPAPADEIPALDWDAIKKALDDALPEEPTAPLDSPFRLTVVPVDDKNFYVIALTVNQINNYTIQATPQPATDLPTIITYTNAAGPDIKLHTDAGDLQSMFDGNQETYPFFTSEGSSSAGEYTAILCMDLVLEYAAPRKFRKVEITPNMQGLYASGAEWPLVQHLQVNEIRVDDTVIKNGVEIQWSLDFGTRPPDAPQHDCAYRTSTPEVENEYTVYHTTTKTFEFAETEGTTITIRLTANHMYDRTLYDAIYGLGIAELKVE